MTMGSRGPKTKPKDMNVGKGWRKWNVARAEGEIRKSWHYMGIV